LWTAVDGLRVPLLLVRGSRSTVVSDEDAAELVRRQPTTRLAVVAGAGHSIQGDQPLALAGLLSRFAGD
jgi:pimeloyl-ACP methyl ester carboxylesterase